MEADRGQILFRRPPDLEIQRLDISDEVELGERFKIEVRVRNNGPGKSAPTEVSLYYSPNRHRTLGALAEEHDLYIAGSGTIDIPSLEEDERETVSLWVEAPEIPDRYYYGAFLTSNIHDTDYQGDLDPDVLRNNFREKRVEVMSSPDLIVSISLSTDNPTLDPGEPFQLEATVWNQGNGVPERNAALWYYRSSDTRISRSDNKSG